MPRELLAIAIGVGFHTFQDSIGMASLQVGVEYYRQVHLSFWNSLIHTLCMPITMFGMFLWVPALFKLDPLDAYALRKYVCIFYMVHYSQIRLSITLLVIVLYAFPYRYSVYWYHRWYWTRENILLRGLFISTLALLVQEIVGHWLGGDDPSRVEGILNAMVYAPYYSVSHFF